MNNRPKKPQSTVLDGLEGNELSGKLAPYQGVVAEGCMEKHCRRGVLHGETFYAFPRSIDSTGENIPVDEIPQEDLRWIQETKPSQIEESVANAIVNSTHDSIPLVAIPIAYRTDAQ